jgi:hypothetical protein
MRSLVLWACILSIVLAGPSRELSAYLSTKADGCGVCDVELTYFDGNASPTDPLFKKDDWIAIKCEELSASFDNNFKSGQTHPGFNGESTLADVGAIGVVAMGQLNSEDGLIDSTSLELNEQNLVVSFMGTYRNA